MQLVARAALLPSSLPRRWFSVLVKNGTTPQYVKVPFKKEDIESVIEEVPDFKYYMVGDKDPVDNIYANTPLTESIINPQEEKAVFEPIDQTHKYSVLENGLRIISLDKGGLTSSLGLYVNCGTRHETPDNVGVGTMIEALAYHSTGHLSWLRTIKTIETLGAKASCTAGREHIVYSAECLREYMPIMIPILTGNVLFPRLLPWELFTNADKVKKAEEKIRKLPDAYVTELLHLTAWHNNTLGNRLHATEKSMAHFNPQTIRSFMLHHFSPKNMVFVGMNVDHGEFTKWLMRAYVDYKTIQEPTAKTVAKPVYTGGDCRVEDTIPMTHMAIGFETPGGWNSPDLVPLTVLQALLGGGGSFSTGGPGKGMYSRLFLNVLNRHGWVENCMAFNTQYTDSGLMGIFISASPHHGPEMVKTLSEEFSKLRSVTAQELSRAKASLKSSIWMNLENRAIVMEDIARQLLMSDKIVEGKKFCEMIDAVTEADIARAVNSVLCKKPTVVSYGDLRSVPHYDEICKSLSSAIMKK